MPPVDIFLSHDWPVDITNYGDRETLLRVKPRFESDVMRGAFGAPPLARLMQVTAPRYWFAGHMHVKFPAMRPHPASKRPADHADDPTPTDWLKTHALNPSRPTSVPIETGRATRFLALSKPEPGRSDWYQILDIPAPDESTPPKLSFDPEWLAICKATQPVPLGDRSPPLPRDVAVKVKHARADLDPRASGPVSDVQVFAKTAPAEGEGEPESHYVNPQTTAFCAMLGIQDVTNPRASNHSAVESNKGDRAGNSQGHDGGNGHQRGNNGRGRGGNGRGRGGNGWGRGESRTLSSQLQSTLTLQEQPVQRS